jgi:MoaA/NifB/PqqE/SkfB family radical SAM enzyme
MIRRLLYAPFLVQVVVTRRCNLACAYCNEFDDHSAPVPTGVLKERFRLVKELGAWALDFSGGEPLLHPDAVELVTYAKRLGFFRVTLITNGFLLNERTIRQLNDAGLDEMQISVDGVKPTPQSKKTLKPLRAKLEMAARVARFAINLNAVLGSAAVAEVREVVAFARWHGLRPTIQLVHDHEGQLRLTREELDAYYELQGELGRGLRAGDYRLRLMRDGRAPFKCRAGSRYLYVDEDGMVRWCSQQRHTFGIPLEQFSRWELVRQFYTRKDCNPACTVGCVRNASRYEEVRPQFLKPDPAAMVGPGPA